MHADDFLAKIETHAQPDRFPTPDGIFFKQLRHIDSLESFSIIFDDDMEGLVLLVGLHGDHRIFFILEFDGIIQEIGYDLLELDPVYCGKSDCIVDPVYKPDVTMHTRVYIILRVK